MLVLYRKDLLLIEEVFILESLRDSLTKFTIDFHLKAHLSLIMSEIA
jgi:hypothetical protein